MRHRSRWLACLIALAIAASAVLAACGGSSTPPPSPSPSRSTGTSGDAPPVWVANEALWQAMYSGDPHPTAMQWTRCTVRRASSLLRSESQLAAFYTHGGLAATRVYAVTETGDFTPYGQTGRPAHARHFLLLLAPDQAGGGSVRAADHSLRPYDLASLGPVHDFSAQPPVTAGVWGQTSWSGGPFPGSGGSIADVTVQVYRGSVDFATVQSATPLTTVVSDTDGFFTAPLGPGSYTFMFRHSNWGPGTSGGPVAVASGRAVAVPVFASVP